MIVFAIFFSAAIAYRVATAMLTIAAVSRREFLPSSHFAIIAVWLSPLYLAMIYDFYKSRIIHPAYVTGLLTLAIVPLRGQITPSNAWQSFASWFITMIT
jgi:hypothetical protein